MQEKIKKVLNYEIKSPIISWISLLFASIIFSIYLWIYLPIIDGKETDFYYKTGQLIGFLLLFILLVSIYIRYERNYYNGLILLAQEILKDGSQENHHDYVAFVALMIIETRLTKYDKMYWVDKDKGFDEPYAISLGEHYVFGIVTQANENNISSVLIKYPHFNLRRFNKVKSRAINYKNLTEENKKSSYWLAESLSNLNGKNKFDILDQWDNDYKKGKEKQQELNELKERKNEDKVFQVGTGLCPYCLQRISRLARKCPHCTMDL